MSQLYQKVYLLKKKKKKYMIYIYHVHFFLIDNTYHMLQNK